MGVGLILAGLIIVRHTQKRLKQMSLDPKEYGTPLYAVGSGLALIGTASLIIYAGVTFFATVDYVPLFLLPFLSGSALTSWSALWILGLRKYSPILWAIVLPLLVASAMSGLFPWVLSIILVPLMIMVLFMYLIPAGLFGALAFKTRKLTNGSLTLLLFTLPLYYLFMVSNDPSFHILIALIRFICLASTGVAFLMPNIRAPELLSYTLPYSVIALVFSMLMTSAPAVPNILVGIAIMAAVSAVALGTSAYLLARYRQSRASATLFLSLFFGFTGLSYILITVRNVGAIEAGVVEVIFTSYFLAVFANTFMGFSAVLALNWKRAEVVPLVAAIPALIYLVRLYPADPRLDPNIPVVMGATGFILMIFPAVLYIHLYLRMRAARTAMRSRPLFLGIGLFLTIVGNMFLRSVIDPVVASILLLSFIVMWLGITGRAERLLRSGGGKLVRIE
ncbi:MAG: hypothetical protein QXQ81_10010 [Candidatus Thorarchaeota archaeon]